MYKDFIKIWHDFYLNQTGNKYMFDLIDGSFIKKFVKLFEHPEDFDTFLRKGIPDHWVQDKLSLRLVYSHRNEIMQRATKSQKEKQRIYTTYTEEDRAAELLLSQQWRKNHKPPEA